MIREDLVHNREAFALLSDALCDLLLRAPLAGLSCLGAAIEIVEETTIRTMATDGRRIYYSPTWVMKKGTRAATLDLLHEWLHIVGNHCARIGDRDPHWWNIACDMWVVIEACELLTTPSEKWEPPEDGVIPPLWAKDLTVEDIYERLINDKELQERTKKNSVPTSYAADLDYGKAGERTQAQEQYFYAKFTEELHQIMLVTEKLGQTPTSGQLISRLKKIMQGQVPWGSILVGDILYGFGQDVPTYAPPRRRFFPVVTLPSYKAMKERILLIGVDVSGSISERLKDQFASNILSAALRADKTYVAVFDAHVREVIETRHPDQVIRQLKLLAGAHSYTSTVEVFALADKVKPSSIAILTDAYVVLPPKAYPNTHWVTPEQAPQLAWGKQHRMAFSW